MDNKKLQQKKNHEKKFKKESDIIFPQRKSLKLDELDLIPYYNEFDEIIDNKKMND